MSDPATPSNDVDRLLDRAARVRTIRPRRRVPAWLLLLALVAVGGVAAVLYYVLMPLDAPLPDGVATRYAGIPRGTTEAGFPRLGDPDAPVMVENFSSFACTHCAALHARQFASLLDEIAAGRVQWVFIPIPHIGSGSGSASRGALCAGEQGRFWEMHDVLFDWNGRFLTRAFDTRRIEKGAEALGLDMPAFKACMDSSRVEAITDMARAVFTQRGLRGTPSLFIDGTRVETYSELEALDTSSSIPIGEGL
jgi:protein-disulfide isomerase